MYIIGFRGIAKKLILVLLLGLIPITSSVADEAPVPDPEPEITVETCVARPTFQPLFQPRPTRNRPFAFSPAMQKIDGVFGIDISRWDHPQNKFLDFPKIRNAGFEFVFIKLSDGATNKAHQLAGYWWKIDRPAAEQAGFLVGGYHFAYPRGTTPQERQQDAFRQAQQAAKRYGVWTKGRLPLVLDLEVIPQGKWAPRAVTDWALDFLREAERLTKRPPIIYSYANYFLKHMEPDLEMVKYPLWVAHYGVHLREPAKVAPWSLFDGHAAWQFSSSGRTPGKHRNVGDLNVSSTHWLDRLIGNKTNHPWADPLSTEQIAAFNSIAKGGNGERFHLRTGSSREGLTTWQTWTSATNRCTNKSSSP